MNFNTLVNTILEKCWDGYVRKGTKKKGKRLVPNCVEESSLSTNILNESTYKFIQTNKYSEPWDGIIKYDGDVYQPERYATTIYLNRFKDTTFSYEPISKREYLYEYSWTTTSTPEHLQPRPTLPGNVRWPSDYVSYEDAIEHIKHVVEDRILPFCEDAGIYVDIDVPEFIDSLTQLIRDLFEPYKWVVGTWTIIAFDAQTITFAVTVDHHNHAKVRQADIQNSLKNADSTGFEDLL
jgi:hypothetical protein